MGQSIRSSGQISNVREKSKNAFAREFKGINAWKLGGRCNSLVFQWSYHLVFWPLSQLDDRLILLWCKSVGPSSAFCLSTGRNVLVMALKQVYFVYLCRRYKGLDPITVVTLENSKKTVILRVKRVWKNYDAPLEHNL